MSSDGPNDRTHSAIDPGTTFTWTFPFGQRDSQIAELPDSPGKPAHAHPLPRQMQGYELLEEISSGGMGVVFKARQYIGHEEPRATRFVAIKMILPMHQGRAYVRERFRTEAQNSARLDHPHIVPIYEVGEWGNLPFFSMKFIEGGTLADLLRQESWNIYRREAQQRVAQLLIGVARAVHHAHQHGILHRDLKPSNILIDSSGNPNVTDFGIAKRIDDDQGLTGTGAILGTPSYMSPEQAAGEAKKLTTASDVYSLGAILYEMLVGKPPFVGETFLETLSKVREGRVQLPRSIIPVIDRDLKTICLKCLEREPAQRYDSTGALADDLERWLRHEPIRARPSTAWERFYKWIRRRPGAAALVGASALGLIGIIVLGILLLQGKIDQAERETNNLLEKAKQAKDNDKKLDAERHRTLEQLEQTQRSLATSQLWRVGGLWQRDPVRARQLLEDEMICPVNLRDFTWGFYHRLTDVDKGTRAIHTDEITSIALAPDNRLMVSASMAGDIKIFDLVRNEEMMTLPGHTGGTWALAFDPSGERFFSAGADGTIKAWTLDGKEQKHWQAHDGSIWSLAITADGKYLASGAGKLSKGGNSDGRWGNSSVKLWDLATGKARSLLEGTTDGTCLCLAFASDNSVLVAGTSAPSALLVWDLRGNNSIVRVSGTGTGWIQGVAVSPDNKMIALGCADHSVRLCDLLPARDKIPIRVVERARLRGHTDELWSVAFNPMGDLVASTAWDGTIRVWEVVTGQQKHLFRSAEGAIGHNNPTLPVRFARDGGRLYEGRLKQVRAWDLPSDRLGTILPETQVFAMAVSRDSKTLAVAGWNNRVVLWDLATGEKRVTRSVANRTDQLFFTANDRCLIAVNHQDAKDKKTTSGCEILVWSGDEQTAWTPLLLPNRMIVALDADGETLLVAPLPHAAANREIECWRVDAASRTLTKVSSVTIPDEKPMIVNLVSLRSGRVLCVRRDGKCHLLDWKSGEEVSTPLSMLEGTVVAPFPDGQRIVTCGTSIMRIVNLESGSSMHLEAADSKINCLAVSPDGKTIAGGGNDELVRLWDVGSGQIRAILPGHLREVRAVTFAPSGNLLISSAGYSGTAWWVRGGEVLLWSTDSLSPAIRESYRLRDRVYDSYRMLMARGMTAEGHADWELARKYYLEAADKWPTDAALWKSLGRIQFRLDQFEKAAEAFHKSLELSSSDSNTYWWLAATLLLSNQKEEYQKLIERMDRLGHVGTSWAELARTTNLGKNSPEAAQRALMLAEKGTADRSAPDWQFRLLATSRIRAGQLDEGVKYHLDAVKRLPNSRANMLHWLPLAIAAHQRGDRSETQKWFDLSKEQMAQLRKEFSPELSTPLNVHINDWIEAQVLYREVSELLENQKK